ncbi:protein IQ-DOMAIN 33 [Diospyros lotus]|uniref:protein IQ-DOMAIN 33 n=1 Tax=Diospyros lotus TaxID=55363 RepID=UPI002254E159|nr:protein IQ-DOMAIN 33 [Diospyros lotus]
MGITGELVRSVFFKSKAKNSSVEKRKWRSSVRTYLCGDEFNSVLAEEDSDSAFARSSAATITHSVLESSEASIAQPCLESSEATVTQPIAEELAERSEIQSKEEMAKEKKNSTAKLFRRDDAAIVIQSAFRHFLARRRNEAIRSVDGSASAPSVGTSIEVQTGNSTEVFSTREEISTIQHRSQQKTRVPMLKPKEDWDDSTVSSNISKMRIQNRLEATTRRERALAYAFSQQLRICSKKNQTRSEGVETNVGWSWLERWMATRLPESSPFENHAWKQLEQMNITHRSMVRKRLFDVAGEEKESCGSNEVSVQIDSVSVSATVEDKDDSGQTRSRLRATRSISKRKTAPSYHCPQASKRDGSWEDEKDKRQRQKQAQAAGGSKGDIKCKDASLLLSPDAAAAGSASSKLGS